MNPAMPWIEHLMQDEGLSYPQAKELLEGYEMVPYVEDDIHKATLIKKNAEVHFAIFKQFRGRGEITRRKIREFLQPILAGEGFLVTKISEDDSDTFITRLGFVKVGSTQAGQRIYMLTCIRFLEK
jgi:hypothetical protein